MAITALKELAYWADRVNSLQHAGNEILPSTWSSLWDATNAANTILQSLQ